MNQKVSIIIACYNDPDIATAINSAYEQEYKDREIIVVDDGSNSIIKSIIEANSNKIDILLSQENKGQAMARNSGIEKSSGKFILNHDSDDFFEKSFCSKAVEVFNKEKDVKIVTSKIKRFKKDGNNDIIVPEGGSYENFLFSNGAPGSSMFLRSEWERVSGYEEILPILGFEDWELYLNMLKDGGRAYVIDEVLFHYQVREGSTTQLIKNEKDEKFRHIILKHRDLYSSSDHFASLVNTLFKRVEKNKAAQGRILDRPEYRLGKLFLKPMRTIKNLFKK
ncbi:glycosyltransferase [Gramella jeungdoensis]|uniref:Glycosyltransferase n=1 Tax=Gramella jeungdoensis TaxID=708091 RepID=A0ABT0Z0G5_9FLAO|nr:glycosyltransferase [Gramella jeungdoensis]MCM8569207.1 glycosyltransferase [Gramella jeungdoensis]